MKKLHIPLRGTYAEMLHTVRVQMSNDLDPQALEAELHRRARADHRKDNLTFGATFTTVERAPQDEGKQCYNITFLNVDALPAIYDILAQIDADLTAAQEQQRLLSLLATEPTDQDLDD